MVQKYGPENSHEERSHQRMHILYAGQMRERQVFMDELKEYRKQVAKRTLNAVKKAVGPIWYHTLSVPQRVALDGLEQAIYQDLLEGLPVRTAQIMRLLGLFPRPNNIDLMNCLFLSRNDPKEMLAQLFLVTYGHSIDGKRSSYCLNAKLMLSAILYLGLNNLIELLRLRFGPDTIPEPRPKKTKAKPEPPLKSPYLQKMIAALYLPPERRRRKPAPLPNLDDLNEPYEEEPPIPKPPPPPPPPPPPKKRLPISYCDKLAGLISAEPHTSITTLTMKTVTQTRHRQVRGSKMTLTEVKKSYGISVTNRKKGGGRKKKPVAPHTGIWNAQYLITGVYQILGKTVYVLGSVSILPALGDLIHGGYRYMDGECINIHCGFRAKPPPPKPDSCDCVKQWQDKVLQYVKNSKCYCRHNYDYGNEGTFPPEELPFFQKPTGHTPLKFNYETIYDLDPKRLHVEKEFKRIWENDSMLQIDSATKDKKDKKKKKKRSSSTCLGENPKPEDYLKCALRLMRKVNIAARLPDIHLVPELREWMRNRIFGPYNDTQKKNMLRKSTTYWSMFQCMGSKGYGHVPPPRDPAYSGLTTWEFKQDLNDKFTKFTYKYKLALFRSLAKVNNLLWPTMYQAEFPDKKFREIYFSYLCCRLEDMHLMHPYCARETTERKFAMARKRYICIPAGVENLD